MNFTHFFDKKLPNNRLTQPVSKNSGSATISINLKMFISMEMDAVSNRITKVTSSIRSAQFVVLELSSRGKRNYSINCGDFLIYGEKVRVAAKSNQ